MPAHGSYGLYKRLFIILALAASVVIAIVLLFDPVMTLKSFKHIDENLYVMTYHGKGLYPKERSGLLAAYEQRIQNYIDLADQMTLNATIFSVHGKDGANLLGHNYNDANEGPVLFLLAKPHRGYSSVSIVNLAYLGIENLKNLGFLKRLPLFLAPTIPLDGMNEHGLMVATSAVRPAQLPTVSDKQTITGFNAIQLLLGQARDVDEAIELLREYHIKFDPWPAVHYLIADALGKSVVVEYLDGEFVITPAANSFQVLSNFYLAQEFTGKPDEPFSFLNGELRSQVSKVEADEAMVLLEATANPRRTRWSAVFNSQTKEVSLVVGQNYDEVHNFRVVKK